MRGLHHTVISFIRSQPNPADPVGTVINVNSGLAGIRVPGNSAYSTSKLAAHAYIEFVGIGKPSSRVQHRTVVFLLIRTPSFLQSTPNCAHSR